MPADQRFRKSFEGAQASTFPHTFVSAYLDPLLESLDIVEQLSQDKVRSGVAFDPQPMQVFFQVL